MKKLTISFYFTFFFVVLTSCGQVQKQPGNGAYIVDGAIKRKVDEKARTFFSKTISSMEVKAFENDSVILDTYSKGKSIDDCILISSLEGDT